MIGIIFSFGTETVEIRVEDSNVYFRTSQFQRFGNIDTIKLDKKGVIKEFPDLKNNDDWQKIARERFKGKMKGMKSEMERVKYLINDLQKFGYQPKYFARQGHRPVRL